MRRTELLEEIRIMRYNEAYGGWEKGCLTQAEAAQLLGVCERTFRIQHKAQRLERSNFLQLVSKGWRLSQLHMGKTLQVPQDGARRHYVKVKVRVHRCPDGTLGSCHGSQRLAAYDSQEQIVTPTKKTGCNPLSETRCSDEHT